MTGLDIYRTQQKYFDFTIQCADGVNLYASMYALSSNSQFSAMFRFNGREASGSIAKTRYSSHVMRYILYHIDECNTSTDIPRVDEAHLPNLLDAANYYDIDELKDYCVTYMLSSPKPSYIELASKYDLNIQHQLAITLLRSNNLELCGDPGGYAAYIRSLFEHISTSIRTPKDRILLYKNLTVVMDEYGIDLTKDLLEGIEWYPIELKAIVDVVRCSEEVYEFIIDYILSYTAREMTDMWDEAYRVPNIEHHMQKYAIF